MGEGNMTAGEAARFRNKMREGDVLYCTRRGDRPAPRMWCTCNACRTARDRDLAADNDD